MTEGATNRFGVKGLEDAEEMRDIGVLGKNPLCLRESRIVTPGWMPIAEFVIQKCFCHEIQAGEVLRLGGEEEWSRAGIAGEEVVSKRREHRHKTAGPVSQRKHAKCIDNILDGRDRREHPLEFLLVDTLGKKRDYFEDPSSVTKGDEHRGIERQVNGGGETIGGVTFAVPIRQDPCPSPFPLLDQPVIIPQVLESNGRKEDDRERVTLEFFEQAFNDSGCRINPTDRAEDLGGGVMRQGGYLFPYHRGYRRYA